MSSNWPIVLIEGIMVFGGALAFAWWQLRDIKRDQKKAADASFYAYLGLTSLAGGDWRRTPPDPTQEVLR